MPKVHKSIDIKAPLDKVFSYIQDPRNEPEWMQGMIEIKDITRKGRRFQYKWTWKMAGIKLNGEAQRLEDIPNKKIVDKSKGDIESIRTYKFEPHGEITHLDLDVDYKIPIPVAGKMAEMIIRRQNEREAEIDIQNIKDRLEK